MFGLRSHLRVPCDSEMKAAESSSAERLSPDPALSVSDIMKQIDGFLNDSSTRDIVAILKPLVKAGHILHACCTIYRERVTLMDRERGSDLEGVAQRDRERPCRTGCYRQKSSALPSTCKGESYAACMLHAIPRGSDLEG